MLTHQLLLFGLATLPALVVMGVFRRLNAGQPHPVGRLWRVSLAGGVAAVACGVVELGLLRVGPPAGSYLGAAWHGFVVAALVEESAKLLCFRLIVARRPELDTRFNAILSGVQAALGFALVENVLFFEKTRDGSHLLQLLAVRALLAVPMHAIATGLCAFISSRGRLDGVGPGWPLGLLVAVLFHGAYDAAIFAVPVSTAQGTGLLSTLLAAVPIALVLVGAPELRERARLALRRDLAGNSVSAIVRS